jgi:hypothetical protein
MIVEVLTALARGASVAPLRTILLRYWLWVTQHRQRLGHVHIPDGLSGGEQFARIPDETREFSKVDIICFDASGLNAKPIAQE